MAWQSITTAPQDRMLNLLCPGMSAPTKGVLQGGWNARLSVWVLNPFGTVQFTTLFPSMWDEIEAPPT